MAVGGGRIFKAMTRFFKSNPVSRATLARIGDSPSRPTPGSERWYAYHVPCAYCGAPAGRTCRVRRDLGGRELTPDVPGYASNPHRPRVRAGREEAERRKAAEGGRDG